MASFWRICVAIMATFFVIQLFIRVLLRAPYLNRASAKDKPRRSGYRNDRNLGGATAFGANGTPRSGVADRHWEFFASAWLVATQDPPTTARLIGKRGCGAPTERPPSGVHGRQEGVSGTSIASQRFDDEHHRPVP